MAQFRLPYFDGLFAELANSNSSIEKRFGRHVHPGCWPDPAKALGDDDDDFARAAEQLTRELTALAGIAGAFSTASAPTATPTRDTPLRAIAGLRPR